MGRKIYLGVIYFITVICVIFGSCIHIFNFIENSVLDNFFGKFSGSSSQVRNEETLEDFTAIDLEMSVMSVTIMEGDSFSISYNCPEKYVPEYEVKNETLYVSQKDVHLNWPSGNSQKCNMTISIPNNALPSITGQLDVGDVNIKNIDITVLDITADVGNIEITNVDSGSFSLQADVGDINLSDINMTDCYIGANVGDVDMEHCSFTTLDIQADLGDVDVSDILSAQENYRIDLETDLGEVSVNDKNYKKDYFSEASSNAEENYKLTIYVATGDVDVSFR